MVVIAAGLFADLRWGEWAQATVTALVVDLGDPATAGTLRDRLARTLQDPTLTIGYWLVEQNGYVDESGRPVVLPSGDDRRAVRLIDDAGAPLAVLIHDPDALDDPALLAGITAATRLAVANARLQAEVRARLEDVKASRRRLLDTADEQRRRLELELHNGAERQLAHVAELLADSDPQLAEAKAGLDAARSELRELARGIHPATLTDTGLGAALTELAARSPVPVKLTAAAQRWPPAIEAAAYFICSEALANITKHAHATQADIHITNTETELRVEVARRRCRRCQTGRRLGTARAPGPRRNARWSHHDYQPRRSGHSPHRSLANPFHALTAPGELSIPSTKSRVCPRP